VFTCVAALALAGALDRCDGDLVAWWLAERQTRSGGLNGRPEKLQDVCYSWWCLSCLSILGRLEWIDTRALTRFILWCQVGRRPPLLLLLLLPPLLHLHLLLLPLLPLLPLLETHRPAQTLTLP
jgi:hypothetical protein